jgi:deoxyribodipyrimidine photolyase-related protein
VTHPLTLVPVLGDQLSLDLSSLEGLDPASTIVLMMEVDEETRYVRHHKAKLVFFLSAMRHHAAALQDAGWHVDYIRLDDQANSGSLTGEVARAIKRHSPAVIRATEAGEWRVRAAMAQWTDRFIQPVTILPDTRFICTRQTFMHWAEGRKQLRMEYFYRDMRRQTGLLMNAAGEPEGGQWNFDADNRKPLRGPDLLIPQPLHFPPDAITRAVMELVAMRYADHPGSLDAFGYAVTREDALAQQQAFTAHALPGFGDHQDAMLTDQPMLWHSVLSPYLNTGLLDPLTLCQAVEAEWAAGRVPINAAEGFIRQVIGWREYVRGIYDWFGPDYGLRNALDVHRPLPSFYYDGQTDMNCLSQSIGQTLNLAYAHHIQRLMITGNFALLAGLDPAAVHRWYLEVYVDAIEWVEMPNTLGMALFADGGVLASKPYAASGAYINRMSDYCQNCRYAVKQRTGPDACPFNALYWDFIARNAPRLRQNPRMALACRSWDNMAGDEQDAIRAQAKVFLDGLTLPR